MIFAQRRGSASGYGVPPVDHPQRSRARRHAWRPRRHLRALGRLGQQLDDVERPAERRDDVDAARERARTLDQLLPEREPDLARAGPRGSVPLLHVLRDDDPRHLVVDADASVSVVRIGQTPTSTGTGQPPIRSRNASSASRSNRICVIAKRVPAATLR